MDWVGKLTLELKTEVQTDAGEAIRQNIPLDLNLLGQDQLLYYQ